MASLRKQWNKNEEASTTIWDNDWLYMKKQQVIADRWDGNKTTPTYIIHEATTCKTWGIDHNTSSDNPIPYLY